MRNLITLMALAVVGATAPAAPYGLHHVSGTLVMFFGAAVTVLGTCLLSGWLMCEARSVRRGDGSLLARLAERVPFGARVLAELPAMQGSALMVPRRSGALGEPGESVLVRARTPRRPAVLEPVAADVVAEPSLQRR